MDLFEVIKNDHRRAQNLFSEIENSDSTDRCARLFQALDTELSMHTTAEESTFYPTAEDRTGDKDLISHAYHEHSEAKELLEALRHTDVNAPEFRDKVHTLKESVVHHMQEEEEKLFPEMQEKMDPESLDRLKGRFMEAKNSFLEAQSMTMPFDEPQSAVSTQRRKPGYEREDVGE